MSWRAVFSASSEWGKFTCAAISPNSDIGAVSSEKGQIILFDLNLRSRKLERNVHSDAINQIVWSKNGKYIVSCSTTDPVKLFNSENLDEINTYEIIDASITCVDISPSCDLICGADKEGRLFLWSTSSPNDMVIEDGHTDSVTSIHFYSSMFVITSGLDGIVRIFSCDGLTLLKTFSDLNIVSYANFAPDPRYMIMSCLNSVTYIYNIGSGQTEGEFNGYINTDYIISPVFVYDKKSPKPPLYLIFPSEDGQVLCYLFADQKLKWSFKVNEGYFKFDISCDSRYMITAGVENMVFTIWEKE